MGGCTGKDTSMGARAGSGVTPAFGTLPGVDLVSEAVSLDPFCLIGQSEEVEGEGGSEGTFFSTRKGSGIWWLKSLGLGSPVSFSRGAAVRLRDVLGKVSWGVMINGLECRFVPSEIRCGCRLS